jgi:leucyl aminopeptidase (aminopeptidase T)
MTREELVKEGLNESITHVDFMVGSKEGIRTADRQVVRGVFIVQCVVK